MNMRWDAVVDRRARRPQPAAPALPESAASTAAEPLVCVSVWLYGTLAQGVNERPVMIRLPARFSVDAVLAALVLRLGEDFGARVLDADGRRHGYCRVFVDGVEIEDGEAPVHAGAAPATVEMILLTAIEGG